MKLKTRLIIAFITVTVLPLMISVAVIFAFSRIQLHNIERTYGVTAHSTYDMWSNNSLSILNSVTETNYQNLKRTASLNGDKFDDETYLNRTNRELEKVGGYLIVRNGDAIVYAGSPNADVIYGELPAYGNQDSSMENGVYIGGESPVLVRQVDFLTSDHLPASAFIVMEISRMVPEVAKLFQNIVLAIILILVATAGILIVWIYRGVANPLGKMKIATQNIKEGNLEYKLEVTADDEIGQLCLDFEEMRIRLKDNAEEKVENDKRSKELISNISHDLKTPITAIKGYVEGIMDGVADTPEKMERYIKTIYNKANEMDLLINELTLYSKIDANRIPYNFNTISVNEYFADCAGDLQMDLEARGISFSYINCMERDVKIIADAEQLKRAINNIVSNSVKYMDKSHKEMTLRVKDAGDFIQVEIEDNGKGIGPKELPHIFDRFYRTDASRNSATGGSGIGLSIVQKIVEEHGGNIWATSKEGVGTTMYFVIRKYQEVSANE